MEAVRKASRLFLIEFDYESTATFEWDSHDKASRFLRDFHRSIASSRFHCCHGQTPIRNPVRCGEVEAREELSPIKLPL
jgi:hypothetical protein